MKNSGIVYEVIDNKVIVLNPEGEFVLIKKEADINLGQLIQYSDSSICVRRSHRPLILLSSSAAAVLIFAFVLLRLFLPSVTSDVYGFVDIDINPSTEFVFDKDQKVIEVIALNSDAQQITNSLDVRGLHLVKAVESYIKKVSLSNFISTDSENLIYISAAYANEKKDAKNELDQILISLDKQVDTIAKKGNLNLNGVTAKVTATDRESSTRHNISMGKYHLYSIAKNKGATIDVDSAKTSSVSYLAKAAGLFDDKKPTAASVKNNKSIVQKEQHSPVPYSLSPKDSPTPHTKVNKPSAALSTKKPKATLKKAHTDLISTPMTSKSTPSLTTPLPKQSTGTDCIKLEYYSAEKNTESKDINYLFKLTNTSNKSISLKDVKIRYYFTSNGQEKLDYYSYFYNRGSKTDVECKFYSNSTSNADDKYFEITFKSGDFAPSEQTFVFGACIKENWNTFDQSDDYSYNSDFENFTEWNKITVYLNDSLVWGKEP